MDLARELGFDRVVMLRIVVNILSELEPLKVSQRAKVMAWVEMFLEEGGKP